MMSYSSEEMYTESGGRVLERIISAAEKLTGLAGVVYFSERGIPRNSFLLRRMGHKNAYCESVKRTKFKECLECCCFRREANARVLEGPFVETCDFGVTELVVPLMSEDHYLATISFGRVMPTGNHRDLIATGELFFYAFSQAAVILERNAVEKTVRIRQNNIVARTVEELHHPDSEISSQKEMADHLGISSEYLSRLFRKTMGKRYVDFVNELKVSRAQGLLKTTSLSINDIAGELGFSRHSYFARLFKAKTGLTPRHYRECHRRSDTA